jgi:alkylation response protein AidB-like acyl-CoA dehydrogenase
MAEAHERARCDLHGWRESIPSNFHTSNRQLGRLLRALASPDHLARHGDHYARFGAVVATELDAAAIVNNREGNLPRLDRYSPYGVRTEGIENHPSYEICGRAIYEHGEVIAAYAEPHANLRAQALFYLSSHVGEAAHNCPVACTAGVVKVLQGPASAELREAFLGRVLERRYEERFDGAQFLTELQGGSDVGANAVEARPDGEAYGTTRWRIHGEKWFCSNPGADLILMTARVAGGPNGTPGLGLFLVPRTLPNGRTNDFRLRRLKEKLGTRSMPSAEIDFEGAEAYAIGRVEDGFKHVMNFVINTSRLYNSVGCAGISRRAHLEAAGYARARRAFGKPVAEFPLVREMLASTFATSRALAAGALTLAAEADRVERGEVSEAHKGFLRVATNLVKMRSCQHSHRTVLTGIETLGGNGAIESFSVLPRLLRDNVVYENWEGTHNTLVAQTVRDMQRPALRDTFFAGLAQWLTRTAPLAGALGPAAKAIEGARAFCSDLPADEGFAALALRPHAEALADSIFALAYASDLLTEDDAAVRDAEAAALAHFVAHTLEDGRPARDAAYAARIQAIMAIA